MRILICDVCECQVSDQKGIRGREFEYHGFQTLTKAFRTDKVVDVCGPCFKKLQDEHTRLEREHRDFGKLSWFEKLSEIGRKGE